MGRASTECQVAKVWRANIAGNEKAGLLIAVGWAARMEGWSGGSCDSRKRILRYYCHVGMYVGIVHPVSLPR